MRKLLAFRFLIGFQKKQSNKWDFSYVCPCISEESKHLLRMCLCCREASLKTLPSSHVIAVHSLELSKWAQDSGSKIHYRPMAYQRQWDAYFKQCALESANRGRECRTFDRLQGKALLQPMWEGTVYVCFERDVSWKTGSKRSFMFYLFCRYALTLNQ